MRKIYRTLCVVCCPTSAILLICGLITGYTTLKTAAVFFIALLLCCAVMCVLPVLGNRYDGRPACVFRGTYMIGNIAFAAFAASFVIIQIIIATGAHTDEQSKNADFVLVLGAGIEGDRPSRTLTYRLSTALDFANENPHCKLIVCGGQAKDELFSEASVMKNWLIENGFDESRIIVEDRSTTTVQNIKNAKNILNKLQVSDYKTAVVSNNFHLFRARHLMKHAGLEPNAISAPSPASVYPMFLIREYFSILKMIVLGQW